MAEIKASLIEQGQRIAIRDISDTVFIQAIQEVMGSPDIARLGVAKTSENIRDWFAEGSITGRSPQELLESVNARYATLGLERPAVATIKTALDDLAQDYIFSKVQDVINDRLAYGASAREAIDGMIDTVNVELQRFGYTRPNNDGVVDLSLDAYTGGKWSKQVFADYLKSTFATLYDRWVTEVQLAPDSANQTAPRNLAFKKLIDSAVESDIADGGGGKLGSVYRELVNAIGRVGNTETSRLVTVGGVEKWVSVPTAEQIARIAPDGSLLQRSATTAADFSDLFLQVADIRTYMLQQGIQKTVDGGELIQLPPAVRDAIVNAIKVEVQSGKFGTTVSDIAQNVIGFFDPLGVPTFDAQGNVLNAGVVRTTYDPSVGPVGLTKDQLAPVSRDLIVTALQEAFRTFTDSTFNARSVSFVDAVSNIITQAENANVAVPENAIERAFWTNFVPDVLQTIATDPLATPTMAALHGQENGFYADVINRALLPEVSLQLQSVATNEMTEVWRTVVAERVVQKFQAGNLGNATSDSAETTAAIRNYLATSLSDVLSAQDIGNLSYGLKRSVDEVSRLTFGDLLSGNLNAASAATPADSLTAEVLKLQANLVSEVGNLHAGVPNDPSIEWGDFVGSTSELTDASGSRVSVLEPVDISLDATIRSRSPTPLNLAPIPDPETPSNSRNTVLDPADIVQEPEVRAKAQALDPLELRTVTPELQARSNLIQLTQEQRTQVLGFLQTRDIKTMGGTDDAVVDVGVEKVIRRVLGFDKAGLLLLETNKFLLMI